MCFFIAFVIYWKKNLQSNYIAKWLLIKTLESVFTLLEGLLQGFIMKRHWIMEKLIYVIFFVFMDSIAKTEKEGELKK